MCVLGAWAGHSFFADPLSLGLRMDLHMQDLRYLQVQSDFGIVKWKAPLQLTIDFNCTKVQVPRKKYDSSRVYVESDEEGSYSVAAMLDGRSIPLNKKLNVTTPGFHRIGVVTVDEISNTSRADFLRFVVLGRPHQGKGGPAEWGLPAYESAPSPVFLTDRQREPVESLTYRIEAQSAPFWLDSFWEAGSEVKAPAVPLDIKLVEIGAGLRPAQARLNVNMAIRVSLEYGSTSNVPVVNQLGTAKRTLYRGRFSGRIDVPMPPSPAAFLTPSKASGWLLIEVSLSIEKTSALSTIVRIPLVSSAKNCFPNAMNTMLYDAGQSYHCGSIAATTEQKLRSNVSFLILPTVVKSLLRVNPFTLVIVPDDVNIMREGYL